MKKKEMKKQLEKEKKGMRNVELDEMTTTKHIIYVSLAVVLFIGFMLIFTKIKTGEWNLFTKKNRVVYSAEIQDKKITCGSILNRKDSKYYVLAFDMDDEMTTPIYQSLTEAYASSSKEKVYYVDLGNSRNNICMDEKLNITNDVKTLKVSNPTLLLVEGGKVTYSTTKYDDMKTRLSIKD